MRRWEKIKNNQKLRNNLIWRGQIIRLIRQWFYDEGFVEIETPALVKLPGMEPYLNPFKTSLVDERGQQHDAYMITSPEYAMKKLLAAGFTKIFQICKCFRNSEPFGGLHNPEFTMLEWYRTGANYLDLMDDTEKLIKYLLGYLNQNKKSKIKNKKYILKIKDADIDLSLSWERLPMKDAFWKFCKLDLNELLTLESITRAAKKRGYKIEHDWRYEDVFFKIFLNEIEPHLGKSRPVFLYDYPAQLAALAKLKDGVQSPSATKPRTVTSPQGGGSGAWAERFELYINSIEIANAFSELTDAKEQRQRLKEERALRQAQGRTIYDLDKDFLAAVGQMPESAGIALGIDRLIMMLLDAKSIEEVISFPASSLFST